MIIETTTDREVIRPMEDVCFEGEPMSNGDWQRSTWWVASDLSVPIGYVGAHLAELEGLAVIDQVGVIPDRRGKGVAVSLLHRCAMWARENGARGVVTYSAPWNVQSARCLMRAGFRMFAPVFGDVRFVYWWRDV